MSKFSFSTDGQELLYGNKRVTPKNWQEADVNRTWNITPEGWVTRLLEPQMAANVPDDVQQLFEVARGSMVYGWYYYPLITLALEQQFRVMETATKVRCGQLGITLTFLDKRGKERHRNYDDLLKDLGARLNFTADELRRWDACRSLRNSVSHPEHQMIMMPGEAFQTMKTACELINRIFQ